MSDGDLDGIWLTKYIIEVENELNLYEQAGAFKWADERGETRHARSMEQLDYVLANKMGPRDRAAAAKEYKEALLDLFKRYKASKDQDRAKSFVEQLKLQFGGNLK